MVRARIRLVVPLVVGVFVLGLAPEVGARMFVLPGISGFTPPAGVVGTDVSITGRGFTGATAVTFNGVAATFTVVDDADITTSVPFGATTGKIGVTTPAGSTTSAASFRVQPVVAGFSPGWGWPGTMVTIRGSAFTGATAVSFHGVAASFTVDSYSQISATVPSGATTGKIRVTTKAGTAASSAAFDVLVAGPGWPQYGYDAANTGYNPNETTIAPGNVSTLQVAWRDKTGKLGGPAGVTPVIANGIAYVGSRDGNLYTIDAATGAPLWSAPTGAAIWSSAAVANGRVYVGSQDGTVHAFDANDGSPLWSATTGSYTGTPVVAAGIVYLRGGLDLYAFDAVTGALRWSTSGVRPTDAAFGDPAVSNGIVYVSVRCTTPDGPPFSPPLLPPPGTDAPSAPQACAPHTSALEALDAASGAPIWSVDLGGSSSAPAVASGAVYVAFGAEVDAFDPASGALLWRSSPSVGGGLSAPSVANGVLYVSSFRDVYALDASTGVLLWSAHPGGDGFARPTVANGVVYVATGFWAIYAFDAASGLQLWQTSTAAPPSIPAVANGTVYFSTYWKANAYRLPPP